MVLSRTHLAASALAVVGNFSIAAQALAAPARKPSTLKLEVSQMALLRACLAAVALAVAGNLAVGAAAMAAPQAIVELTLHPKPAHGKWVQDKPPLFGEYFASGDGESTGAVVGKIAWDLYEDTSSSEQHPAFFRGFVERDGQRYAFEIIGLYTPESADRRHWRITGAIAFSDSHVLGMKQASLTGTFEAGANAAAATAHYTIWAEPNAR
jgi:hypothetical protein